MGVLEVVPVIGNGLYLSYQILINLVRKETVIAANLAVLYLTILSVRLVLEPVLLGRKVNMKIAIIIVLALISKLIGGNSGLAIMTIIIFILNTLMSIKKNERKKRKKT